MNKQGIYSMFRSNSHDRYNFKDGYYHIQLKLKTINQLFDERDPAPFRDKDLDDDAVNYISTSLQELPKTSKSKLLIFIPKVEYGSFNEENIKQAIHDFFVYEEELNRRIIRKTFEIGIKSLLIGLCFLSSAVIASHMIKIPNTTMMEHFIKEGLTLLGWVSMWKPVNIFLYEWWPLKEVKSINQKISKIKVNFKYY